MPKFQVISAFDGQPYYFNCRECNEPLFVEGDCFETEVRREFGFCETCRPTDIRYKKKVHSYFIITELNKSQVMARLES